VLCALKIVPARALTTEGKKKKKKRKGRGERQDLAPVHLNLREKIVRFSKRSWGGGKGEGGGGGRG